MNGENNQESTPEANQKAQFPSLLLKCKQVAAQHNSNILAGFNGNLG